MTQGLAALPSEELERLAVAIERGGVGCPVGETDLRSHGFPTGALVRALDGLDARAATRVLRAVIADRAERPPPRLDLVWTGPETRVATSRDTAVLVRELFGSARREVLIAGFSFDHGEEIFEPLHAVMRDHGVETSIYLDIGRADHGADVDAHVREVATRFLTSNWPFGAPLPSLYYDPRTAAPGSVASLHAKCIVVDLAKTLITSANFTDRGQTRNVELGVLIGDRDFAARVAAQWRSLVESGVLRALAETM